MCRDDPIGWAAPRRRWREARRHEYAWGMYAPDSLIDRLVTIIVTLAVVVAVGVMFTPEIWMPCSILRPEMQAGCHGSTP
jgi:hypothetical protein